MPRFAQCFSLLRDRSGNEALIHAIWPSIEADDIILESYLSEQQRRALFYAADAVLANSGIEPFGLVGWKQWQRGESRLWALPEKTMQRTDATPSLFKQMIRAKSSIIWN